MCSIYKAVIEYSRIPARLLVKMRKSTSVKSVFGHFEEDIVEAKRLTAVWEKRSAKDEADEEV